MNLAVNARDAMPQGGTLSIETKNVYLDEEFSHRYSEIQPGSFVRISVRDTGCGMEESTLDRIFEPFFTTKEVGQGTGLGLSTVFGIIGQSDGCIEVDSEFGKGTTFNIYLPQIEEEIEIEDEDRVSDEFLKGTETILLVEDEDMVRNLARHVLVGSGYTVLDAGYGERALEICEANEGQIDLLVTDVVMPQMSGRELAERLRSSSPGLKVLFMSGYTDDDVVRHGIRSSEVAFMQKPFLPDDLLRKVREVLDTQ